jgi:hypothetical protein
MDRHFVNLAPPMQFQHSPGGIGVLGVRRVHQASQDGGIGQVGH